MKKNYSIRKTSKRYIALMIILFSIIYVSVIVFFFNFNYKSIKESNAYILSNLIDALENDLNDTTDYLMNIYINSDFDALVLEESDSLNVYLREKKILEMMQAKTALKNEKCAYFVYKNMKNAFYSTYSGYYGQEQIDQMNKEIKQYLQNEENLENGKWKVLFDADKAYLIITYWRKDCCVGAVLNLTEYSKKLDNNMSKIIFTYQGIILTNMSFLEENRINIEQIHTNLRFYMVHQNIENIDLEMYYIIPQTKLQGLIKSMLLVSAISIVVIIFLGRWLYRQFCQAIIYPIEQINRIEESLKMGDDPVNQLIHTDVEEYNSINQKMVSMIQQVSELQAQTYEKEIEVQKAKLQYYQLQTEPHFFLNCLKNIYAMAENQNCSEIQYMIKTISGHFRYVFKGNFDDIPLGEEIEEIERYFQLCQMSASVPMLIEKDIDETLLNRNIPILLIQTFVENSIKHARRENKILKICVSVTEVDGQLRILVSDNGKGYPKEFLNGIKKTELLNGHIGICNVLDRIKLVYGEKARVRFFNNQEGGASTEIIIPEK